MSKDIVIVEDETKLATLLRDYLQYDGFNVTLIDRGDIVLDHLHKHHCDLVVLDLMLPGMNGLDICKSIRATSALPVIITTAKVDEIDRLLGLELGADDYICKPYSPREVVARIKTVLRRVAPDTNNQVAMHKQWHLSADTLTVTANSSSVVLTSVEFALLQLLHSRPGRIFSRNELMDTMYSDHRVVSDRTVDSHIKKLRQKLEPLGIDEIHIVSVYGVGYKFEPFPEK